jgi:hypothetical protein
MAGEPRVMICVGATKAGTSWLHDHLSSRADCHFRTIKELHYFTMTEPRHFAAARAKLARERDELAAARAGADPDRAARLERRIADLDDWDRVLARGAIDLAAYRAFLMAGAGGASVVGEVTPAYALMSVAEMKRLAAIGQDTRILFLMRDPVARLWSHVRMIAERTTDSVAAFEAAARGLLARILAGDLSGEGKGIVKRGDYATILGKLWRAFAPAQLLVLFTEDLLNGPGLDRLNDFLGLPPGAARADRKVHEGRTLALEPEAARAARAWLSPQYDFVQRHFPALPAAWTRTRAEGLA